MRVIPVIRPPSCNLAEVVGHVLASRSRPARRGKASRVLEGEQDRTRRLTALCARDLRRALEQGDGRSADRILSRIAPPYRTLP